MPAKIGETMIRSWFSHARTKRPTEGRPPPAARPARRSIAVAIGVTTAAYVLLAVPFRAAPADGATRCTGVHLHPGASIQNAIRSRPGGTTFCLADGKYTTNVVLTPKNGDRFIGVYRDGSRPNVASTGAGGVFKGGKNVVIRGLGIGPSASSGVAPGTGSTIRNDRIHGNRMCGIATAANHLTIIGNEIDHNGTLSNQGRACSGAVNLHGVQEKDAGAYNVVSSNTIHDNAGHGLHVDCDGHDNTFSGNRVFRNAGVALLDETSYHDRFAKNVIHHNGFGWSLYAIGIVDSIGTTVSGNTVTHNYRAVNLWADRRANLRTPKIGLGCADVRLTGYHPSNITVSRNRFSLPQRAGFAPSGAVPLSAAQFDYNCWGGAVAGTNWRLPSDATATWVQWRGAGQDRHGRTQRLPCG